MDKPGVPAVLADEHSLPILIGIFALMPAKGGVGWVQRRFSKVGRLWTRKRA